jgi:hypothetical protein
MALSSTDYSQMIGRIFSKTMLFDRKSHVKRDRRSHNHVLGNGRSGLPFVTQIHVPDFVATAQSFCSSETLICRNCRNFDICRINLSDDPPMNVKRLVIHRLRIMGNLIPEFAVRVLQNSDASHSGHERRPTSDQRSVLKRARVHSVNQSHSPLLCL